MIRRFILMLILGLVVAPAPLEAKKKAPQIRVNRMHLRHANTKKKTRNLRVCERRGKRTVVRKKGQRFLEEHYLKDWRTGKVRRFPERLVWYLYLTAQHFDAEIEIVSGYRHNERPGSRHKQAKAIDFRVVGVDPKEVWAYVKRFDNVGAGYYPNSKFVHLDARDRSYYWVDESGPGEEAQYRQDVAQRKQRKHAKRGHTAKSSKRATSKRRSSTKSSQSAQKN